MWIPPRVSPLHVIPEQDDNPVGTTKAHWLEARHVQWNGADYHGGTAASLLAGSWRSLILQSTLSVSPSGTVYSPISILMAPFGDMGGGTFAMHTSHPIPSITAILKT